jgi:GTPase SAR1 family protein
MSAIIGNTSDNHSLSVGDTERRSGLYILGKPGMGKTSLITNLIQQDIKNGHGVFFLDPTGNAINDLSSSPAVINAHKQGRIVILDPEHETRTFGINILHCRNIESIKERTHTYTRTYNIFHKLWEDTWGIWLQLIIENSLYALIENQGVTLAALPRFLQEPELK